MTGETLVAKRVGITPAARQRALFAVLCFVWGTTWLAMKVGIASVPPGVFAGTRWTSAGLILLIWRWARGQRLQIPMRLTGRLVIGGDPDGVAEPGDPALRPAPHHGGPGGGDLLRHLRR